jgi:NTE family protein
LLSYRPGLEEAGPEKSFDLSATSLAQRWNAGLLDMQQALSETTVTNDILMVRRKDDATRVKAAAAFAV